MKRLLIAAIAAGGLLLAGTATAAEKPGQWYVAPMVSAIWLDDNRQMDDDIGAALSVGYALNEKVNLELHGFGFQLDGDFNEMDYWGYGVDLARVWYRDSRITPYFLGGLGFNKHNRQTGRDGSNRYLNAGFGFLTDLTSSSSIALRTEVRYRLDWEPQESSRDWIANVGLQIPFGRPYAEPMVAAAPPPPPPPPAAPPPPPPPPLDSDGDGVPDSIDRCPGTPPGTRVDQYGCNCDYTLALTFEFGSAALTADDKRALNELIAALRNLPHVRGMLEGHTDNVGSAAYNQGLSERRAQAVADYLHAAGIGDNQFTTVGYGLTRPVADNATAEGRALNRRVMLRRTDCN